MKRVSAYSAALLFGVLFSLMSCSDDEQEPPAVLPPSDTTTYTLSLTQVLVDSVNFLAAGRLSNIDRSVPTVLRFNRPIDSSSITSQNLRFSAPGVNAPLMYELSDSNRVITLQALEPLQHVQRYVLTVGSTIQGAEGEPFDGYQREFFTAIDSTPKFEVISDDALLDLVQEQTFQYFWDFAHPVSGLARERNTSGNLVTIGGSGFGVMCILVGIERGFITRAEGVERLATIVNFLAEADRFHGVWPHWMDGTTGDVIPFSANDNGADLVETAFMIQGLLTVREYLNETVAAEAAIIDQINTLWEEVEWTWFTQGQEVLYWHWSPNLGFIMNHQIRGWNEGLIVYFLAAMSPTYPISADVYHSGWAQNGAMVNGNSYYGIPLPLGGTLGGPLFFAHYSFTGLNPTNLSDLYANYWTQNEHHSLINRAYCADNPLNYVGYSEQCWGLTASDGNTGYSAHAPTNDRGVITPTAALSSFPYTPEASMDALKFFYYVLGDRLWGAYGFYDAFNLTAGWTANSYLAIDQGPIVVMIENHRSQLLWNYFMQAPEVTNAMNTLGFSN